MKKGYFYSQYPTNIPDQWQYVWFNVCNGTHPNPGAEEKWNATNKFIRGAVFVPILTADDSLADNVSKHHEWLINHNPAWRETNAPIVIDYTSAPAGQRLDSGSRGFDGIYDYACYIRDHWDMQGKKPLLRASYAVWNNWLKDTANKSNVNTVLQIVTPLVVRWNAAAVGILADYGVPAWWEYQYNSSFLYAPGLVAYDDTKTWATHPAGVVAPVTPPVTPEPEPEPTEADNSEPAGKYRVHGTLGGMVVDLTVEPI